MACEGCFEIHMCAKIHPGANLPLPSRWSKLRKLHPGVFLHLDVFCAHERKTVTHDYAF